MTTTMLSSPSSHPPSPVLFPTTHARLSPRTSSTSATLSGPSGIATIATSSTPTPSTSTRTPATPPPGGSTLFLFPASAAPPAHGLPLNEHNVQVHTNPLRFLPASSSTYSSASSSVSGRSAGSGSSFGTDISRILSFLDTEVSELLRQNAAAVRPKHGSPVQSERAYVRSIGDGTEAGGSGIGDGDVTTGGTSLACPLSPAFSRAGSLSSSVSSTSSASSARSSSTRSHVSVGTLMSGGARLASGPDAHAHGHGASMVDQEVMSLLLGEAPMHLGRLSPEQTHAEMLGQLHSSVFTQSRRNGGGSSPRSACGSPLMSLAACSSVSDLHILAEEKATDVARCADTRDSPAGHHLGSSCPAPPSRLPRTEPSPDTPSVGSWARPGPVFFPQSKSGSGWSLGSANIPPSFPAPAQPSSGRPSSTPNPPSHPNAEAPAHTNPNLLPSTSSSTSHSLLQPLPTASDTSAAQATLITTARRPMHLSFHSKSRFVFSRMNSPGNKNTAALSAEALRLHAFGRPAGHSALSAVALENVSGSGDGDRDRVPLGVGRTSNQEDVGASQCLSSRSGPSPTLSASPIPRFSSGSSPTSRLCSLPKMGTADETVMDEVTTGVEVRRQGSGFVFRRSTKPTPTPSFSLPLLSMSMSAKNSHLSRLVSAANKSRTMAFTSPSSGVKPGTPPSPFTLSSESTSGSASGSDFSPGLGFFTECEGTVTQGRAARARTSSNTSTLTLTSSSFGPSAAYNLVSASLPTPLPTPHPTSSVSVSLASSVFVPRDYRSHRRGASETHAGAPMHAYKSPTSKRNLQEDGGRRASIAACGSKRERLVE